MKRILLFTTIFLSLFINTYAQLSIPAGGTTATIDFENTITNVSNGSFAGNGFESLPSAGQLDSDAWSTDGFGQDSPFGGSCISDDCARGADVGGGVVTGGIYAFSISEGGDTFLGIQPGGSDFTPGDITLRVINNTGGPIQFFTLSFERWINNDQARGNSFNVSISIDNSSYSELGGDFNSTSPAASDALGFQSEAISGYVDLGTTVANGDPFYIRWEGDDVSGSGSRDEFGIDDIQISDASLLPITLLSFNAQKINQQVALSWETATEINNDYMAVEHSQDGRTFVEIGRVQGAGTTTTPQNYRFIDEAPLSGVNYYRLRQVDFDGRTEYHQVVSVNMGGATSSIRILPNPVNDFTSLQLDQAFEQDTEVRIYDLTGRVVFANNWAAGQQQLDLNLSFLANGSYVIRIENQEEIITERFVKQ